MGTQEIIDRIVSTIQEAPEKAQGFIEDPKGSVAAVAGGTGFDIHAIVQGVLDRLAELGVDLSAVDISKLDLGQFDPSKLDLVALQSAAGKLNIDLTKLDLSKLDMAAAMKSILGGGLGGLFGKRK